MSNEFISIENVSEGMKEKVKQTLKFRTGNFVWRVKFTAPLNPATVNNRSLYVTSLNQVPLKTNIRYNTIEKFIEIEPLEPYAQNESYILTVTKNVASAGGKHLKHDVQVQFKV